MRYKKQRVFIGDFETTVYEGQTSTEVWASASVELGTDEVKIFHSIDEQFEYFKSLNCNVLVFYHNLKFDGSFWLAYLLTELKYKQAYHAKYTGKNNEKRTIEWDKDKDMTSKSFKYVISDMGVWYDIKIKVGSHFIDIRDSLKLLPFSVKRIGDSFKTKHKKLTMEYTGFRYAGCEITEEEKKYIANDVLVVKEAMEIMFAEGSDKMTIGACCLGEYKKIMKEHNIGAAMAEPWNLYRTTFPDLYQKKLDGNIYGALTADEYIRKGYHGGWCYVVPEKAEKIHGKGITADVNSLYPSMMHSESGNYYPVGNPYFWKGNFIPDEAIGVDRFYYVRILTRFYIKPGFLPFIQIKNTLLYNQNEMLQSSDIVDPLTGEHYIYYTDSDGIEKDTRVELTLSVVDYKLFLKHYDVTDFEILDGCWFYAEKGLFDHYIDKYRKRKMENTGALRELAKLFLNYLYGKFAASMDSSFKVAYIKDDGVIGFKPVTSAEKTPGYIAAGAAVTAYARAFTITAAQQNYYGADKPGFIYADTDSIHVDLPPEEVKGIKVDDKAFCCWKLEAYWDMGYFTRQKTYIEHVTHENGIPVEELEKEPYYNIKCAGMGDRSKKIFDKGLKGDADPEGVFDENGNLIKSWTENEKEFLFKSDGVSPKQYTVADFHSGLRVPNQLKQKRIRGGVILYDDWYTMN